MDTFIQYSLFTSDVFVITCLYAQWIYIFVLRINLEFTTRRTNTNNYWFSHFFCRLHIGSRLRIGNSGSCRIPITTWWLHIYQICTQRKYSTLALHTAQNCTLSNSGRYKKNRWQRNGENCSQSNSFASKAQRQLITKYTMRGYVWLFCRKSNWWEQNRNMTSEPNYWIQSLEISLFISFNSRKISYDQHYLLMDFVFS